MMTVRPKQIRPTAEPAAMHASVGDAMDDASMNHGAMAGMHEPPPPAATSITVMTVISFAALLTGVALSLAGGGH